MKRDYACLQDLGVSLSVPTKRLKTRESGSWASQGSDYSIFSSLPSPLSTVRQKSVTPDEKEKRLELFYNYQVMIRKELEEVDFFWIILD